MVSFISEVKGHCAICSADEESPHRVSSSSHGYRLDTDRRVCVCVHIDELWLPALAAMLLLMASCQECDALHIRILNRRGGGGTLLPFDINQLKASRLLLSSPFPLLSSPSFIQPNFPSNVCLAALFKIKLKNVSVLAKSSAVLPSLHSCCADVRELWIMWPQRLSRWNVIVKFLETVYDCVLIKM